MRVANLHDAAEHIGEVLKRVKKEHLERAYKIRDWYFLLDFVNLCLEMYTFNFFKCTSWTWHVK